MKQKTKKRKNRKKRKTQRRGLKIFTVLLVLALLIGAGGVFLGKKIQKIRYPLQYGKYVEQSAKEFGLAPELIYAVIATESSFNKDAVSDVGAMGLTQIMPETFHWLQKKLGESYPDEALFEPEISIRYGAYFYSLLLTKYDGDVKTAAAAYHSGSGQVSKWLKDPKNSKDGKTLTQIPGKNAQHYADKILSAMETYETLYKKETTTNG